MKSFITILFDFRSSNTLLKYNLLLVWYLLIGRITFCGYILRQFSNEHEYTSNDVFVDFVSLTPSKLNCIEGISVAFGHMEL